MFFVMIKLYTQVFTHLSVCKMYMDTPRNWSSAGLTMANTWPKFKWFFFQWTYSKTSRQYFNLSHHLLLRFIWSTASRASNKGYNIRILNTRNSLTHDKILTNHIVACSKEFRRLKLYITVAEKIVDDGYLQVH